MNRNPSRYRHEGYSVFRNGIEGETLRRYQALLDSMIAGLAPGERPENLVEPHVNAVSWRDWLELCRHPRVLDAVQQCLGTPNLVLLMSHLIVKPAGDGLAVAWHQDNTYWPSVTGTDIATVWLGLDASTLENGCMKVIPRSHDGYRELDMIPTDGSDLLKVRVEVTPDMEASAVPIEMAPGDFSLHDSFIIHGSDANRSSHRRAGYTMRYGNAGTVKVELEKHHKPVYYVSGNDAFCMPGWRDIRPGKPLPDHPGEHTSRRFKQTPTPEA